MNAISPTHPGATDPVETRQEVTKQLDHLSLEAKKTKGAECPAWLRKNPVVSSGYIKRFHGLDSVNVFARFAKTSPVGMQAIAGGYTDASKEWLANVVADLESDNTNFVICSLPDGLAVFRVRIESPEFNPLP